MPLLQQIRERVAGAVTDMQTLVETLQDVAPEPIDDPPAAPAPHKRRWLLLLLGRRARGPVATLLRGVALGTAAAFAAIVAAGVLLPLPAALVACALIALLWLATAASVTRRVLARPRIADDRRAARELRNLNRALRLAQAQGDLVRLQRRLGELDTWIAILSELVHRPWVGEPLDGLELGPALDTDTLPAAFAVAIAKPDRRVLEQIGGRARAHAFRSGWLWSIYTRRGETGEDRVCRGH